jgi:hypothetical protein
MKQLKQTIIKYAAMAVVVWLCAKLIIWAGA